MGLTADPQQAEQKRYHSADHGAKGPLRATEIRRDLEAKRQEQAHWTVWSGKSLTVG
jgi:hypothetical protein